jgi:transketolase
MSGMAATLPAWKSPAARSARGLSIAVGMALALKRKRSKSFVYTLFSDGELNEGAVWEAAMSAGSFGLDNLVGIVDVNNMQADGPSTGVLDFEPLAPKFEAFRWHVQRVDGNDIDGLVAAFDAARHADFKGPRS